MKVGDLISVVVPVYNGETFLRENIECILNQTYHNLEIIYICDKCTDHTVPILQEYAAKDSRLIIRNEKERHGADVSRNIGKEMANGEWIIFLDSDDLFELDMLEVLHKRAVEEDADMGCCFWESFSDKPRKITEVVPNQWLKLYCETYPVIDVQKVKKYILQLVFNAPWMKLIHKSIYKKEDVYFQAIPNCDDLYFSYIAAMESKKIVYVDRKLVHYRVAQGRDTISTNQEDGIKENYLWEAFDKTYQYICDREDSGELKKSFYHRLCYAIYGRVGYGVYEKLFHCLRDVYFDKWGMWDIDIQKELSYFNREVYKKLRKGELDMCIDTMTVQAKIKCVQDLLSKGCCSVWGCGYQGHRLLESIGQFGVKIKDIYDSDPNKWGTVLMGKTIKEYEGEWSDFIVITCSQYYEEIREQIGSRAGRVIDLEKEIFMY